MEERKIENGTPVEQISTWSETIERTEHADSEILNLQRYVDNDATKNLRELETSY